MIVSMTCMTTCSIFVDSPTVYFRLVYQILTWRHHSGGSFSHFAFKIDVVSHSRFKLIQIASTNLFSLSDKVVEFLSDISLDLQLLHIWGRLVNGILAEEVAH